MQLEAETTGDIRLVRVMDDRIDAASAIEFKEAMRSLTQGPEPRVVLDLVNVAFIDSSGLGAVVAAMKVLKPDRNLELARLSPTVAKVFHLTRMDTVFAIHEQVPTGLRQAG